MDQAKLAALLLSTFLTELDEHIAIINRDVLALERGVAPEEQAELFKGLFRSAHTIKGSSRAVNAGVIETASHTLEEVLAAARDGQLEMDAALFGLLFETADALGEAGERLRESRSLEESPLNDLIPRLANMAKGDSGDLRTPRPREPTPPEAPRKRVRAPIESSTVRVDADKLDALLARTGELLMAREQMRLLLEEAGGLHGIVDTWLRTDVPGAVPADLDRFRQIEKGLDRLLGSIRASSRQVDETGAGIFEEIHRVRMLPFAEACQGLPRVMRDVASASLKLARFEVEGGDVEIDRSVLEGLRDPLLHLVRNAVDHGIEMPEVRRKGGKSETGVVRVAAALRGNGIEVVVADDGGGVDYARLREKLSEQGVTPPADDAELVRWLFRPGFSTAPVVTDISGRGVGLDVVQTMIESLHGSVEIQSSPGEGTRFVLRAPLTLTTIRVVLVEERGLVYGVPTPGLGQEPLRRFGEEDVVMMSGQPALMTAEGAVPLRTLSETLGLESIGRPGNEKYLALIMQTADGRAAFLVDSVFAERDVMVRPLGARLARVPHLTGCTLLETGRIAVILNVPDFVRTALHSEPVAELFEEEAEAIIERRVLVVDDSLTTRTLVRSILETAGYVVDVAVDGEHALRSIKEARPALIVSDVDMPRMDGFALTAAVKADPDLSHIPVVLVTARQSGDDRLRGIQAGADAYFEKSSFDQEDLIDAIGQLI